MNGFQYISGVVSLTVDEAKCVGCRMCVNVCPQGVFVIENRKAKIHRRDDCMECGACAKNCLTSAITVQCGIGCARALIRSVVFGTEPTCDCSGDSAA